MDERPVPVADFETAPYWAAARAHELKIPLCAACRRYAFPPPPRCPSCRSDGLEWQRVSGRGSVFSFAVMRDTFVKGFPPPYVVAQVELAEQPGLIMIANIVECSPSDVFIGQPVEVTFEDRGPEVTIPQFRPRSAAAGTA